MPRHDDGCGEPCKGVGYSFCIGGPCPDAIAPVVAKGRAKIPTFDGARSPCFSYIGFLVNENLGAWWGERSAVEIKSSMHVGLGG
jgi:hypothetical protein